MSRDPTGSAPAADSRAAARSLFGRLAWVVFALAAVAVAGFLIWQVPQWQLAAWRNHLPRRELLLIENQLRQTLVLGAGGVLFAFAAFVLWRRAHAAEAVLLAAARALAGAQNSEQAERLSRALSALADDRLEIRLGAIYLLEGMARESKREHGPIVEVLCAYVRDRAAWREDVPEPERVPADVQAALTVLGRRNRANDDADRLLDLQRVDLRGADLNGVDLARARLCEAHLEGASLEGANLAEADLRQAFLTGADLVEANLTGANLREAHLGAAYLVEAHLENADLGSAHLEGAYLGGAFLEGADLGGAHLDGAYIYKAHLNGASLHGAHVVSTIGMTRREREEINRSTRSTERRPRGPRALRAHREDDEGEEPISEGRATSNER